MEPIEFNLSFWDTFNNEPNQVQIGKLYNNVFCFYKGPLSQWYGGFSGQDGTFKCTVPDFISERSGDSFSYNCAEQAMMHHKALLFDDRETAAKILSTHKPKEQKALGREVKNFSQGTWDHYKERVVKHITTHRLYNRMFYLALQHVPEHAIIAEASPYDRVWGIGLKDVDKKAYNVRDWQGQNLLGEIFRAIKQKYSVHAQKD